MPHLHVIHSEESIDVDSGTTVLDALHQLGYALGGEKSFRIWLTNRSSNWIKLTLDDVLGDGDIVEISHTEMGEMVDQHP
ncbi:MAG: hypothetical protein WC648_03320 [Candidatus Paceibacterota bacterium]|jgi:hypothetical protein